jgi:stage V sporulation protein K
MYIFTDKSNPFNSVNFSEEVFLIKKLFSRKPNDHLTALIEYFSKAFLNGKIEESILHINSSYDGKIIALNANLVYNHFKKYLVSNYDRKLVVFLIEIKKTFSDLEISELSDLNLEVLQAIVNDIVSDNLIEESEIELAKIICQTFLVNVTEFVSVLNHNIMLMQNDMINGLFVENEKKIKAIKKYYKIANGLNHKYDLQQAFKFINAYNIYSINNNQKLSGLNLNIGIGSLSDFELFNVFNVNYGKIKKSGGSVSVDLSTGKLYNYGSAYFLVKTHGVSDALTGETTILMFNEIKEHGKGTFSNSNEKYFWFKLKGERNSHIISGFEDASIYEYLNKFNSLIDNPSSLNAIQNDKNAHEETGTNSTNTTNIDSSKKVENINYLDELNTLIGLANVKQQITSLVNLIKAQKLRKSKNLKVVNVSLHSVFSGPPGTGKTTVARLYAGILKELGVLSKGHLIEVDRSELVAGYLGQTAIKTEEVINKALDGVLFIDEAYSLTSSSTDSFGEEAVNVLLKRMEDERERLVVIVAGYTSEMEIFINSNPGLQSRFTRYIEFENYSGNELTQIFESLANKNEYKINEAAKRKLKSHFDIIESSGKDDFGNGRYVRNLFEKVVQEHANQISLLANPTDDDLVNITESQLLF